MVKVIMDMDPGIDDAAALSMAINHPEFEIKLVTTVAGNVTVDKTTINALKILDFFDVGDQIPVASGAEQPLIKEFEDAVRIHGESGMPGYDFSETSHSKPIELSAVQAMYQKIMESEDKITLLVTGAATNVAMLFSQYPEVKEKIDQIVMMGGTLGLGNMTSAAEFNVFTDPHASEMMFKSGVPIVMVGLDITKKALLTRESLAKLSTMNQSGKMLHDIISADGDCSDAGFSMHDVNTIFYLLHPEEITTKDLWIDVQVDGPAIGETVADVRGAYHDGKTNAKVCVDINDNSFNEWFLNQVSKMK
ncbi:ribonucleoside hydrolase RihC [Lactobacillus sp. S2-2]|uniref:ribonucleoside hydrolase RihC n=1 Tax=Lactobacillus sp. S2-2 TaxID=2692917 RepID=UPI001EFFCF61|nr:ribonucleoside hydrolase RihC [Lactobacillus sp. S2-2]MCF6515212.1 ribonucleoside hydrolase RihC [Lactobacillus sp. S2-2]